MRLLFLCLSLLYAPTLLQASGGGYVSDEITSTISEEDAKADGTYFGDDSVSLKSKIKTGARLAAYGTAGAAVVAGGIAGTILTFLITGPTLVYLGFLIGPSILLSPMATGVTPLEIAITDDNITKVKKLLSKNPKLTKLTYNGRLPLAFAAIRNTDLDIIKLLVTAYPKAMTIKDKQGNFPIVYAIKSKYSSTTAALKKFVGLKHEDEEKHEVFQYLLDKDPLCINIRFGKDKHVFEKDGDLNNTLFHKAALSNDPYYLQALLKVNPKGAMIKNAKGVLPLHVAVAIGNTEIIKILLKAYPAAVKEKTNDGKTPVQLATNDDIKVMLGAKKEVGFFDRIKATVSSDTTLLHTAAHNGDETEIKKILKKNPEKAQVKDKDGNLPLHLAAMREDGADAVVMLLKAYKEGARVENNEGKIPYDVAESEDIKEKLNTGVCQLSIIPC